MGHQGRFSERKWPPDLLIHLRCPLSVTRRRIALRGRDYEQQIHPEYLEQLNALYQSWIDNFTLCPVLTVPSDDLDYVAWAVGRVVADLGRA